MQCEWCGTPITTEAPVRDAEGNLYHPKCRRDEMRSQRRSPYYDPDRGMTAGREPFIDWPNGQGE